MPKVSQRFELQTHLWRETHSRHCSNCASEQAFGWWEVPSKGPNLVGDIYAQCKTCGSFKPGWDGKEKVPTYLNLTPLA